jgi:hypothetical protein
MFEKVIAFSYAFFSRLFHEQEGKLAALQSRRNRTIRGKFHDANHYCCFITVRSRSIINVPIILPFSSSFNRDF